MYSGQPGGSASMGEILQRGEKPEALDQDPQKSEGFLISEDQEIVSFEGKVEVSGASKPVEYYGSMPIEELKSRLIHLAVPGFGGIKGSYKGFGEHMAAQEGLLTVSFTPARSSESVRDPQQVHEDTIGAVVQDIADSGKLDDLPNGNEIDMSEINAILHSMAIISGARRALSYPSEIRNIISINGIGWEENEFGLYLKRIGPCSLLEILPGLAKGEFKGQRNPMTLLSLGKHLFGNVAHTAGEVVTCHTYDARRDFSRLGRMGIGTGAIFTSDDRLVNADKSFENARHNVDHCITIKGLDHFAPQKRPDETAHHAARMLSELG